MSLNKDVKKALDLAYKYHKGQKRKLSGEDYFVHLLDVLEILKSVNAPDYVLIAGLLHDTLEDTNMPIGELEAFGDDVVRIVKACTEDDHYFSTSKKELIKTWKSRKLSSIKKTEFLAEDELLVKIADKIANLITMKEDLINYGDVLWTIFNADKKEVAWYYAYSWFLFAKRLGEDNVLVKKYWDLLTFVFKKIIFFRTINGRKIMSIWRNFNSDISLDRILSELNPVTNVSGVCFTNNNEVVLVKSVHNDSWVLPGGTPDNNESYYDTLIRELKEEANLSVLKARPIGYFEEFFKDNFTKNYHEHYYKLVFVARTIVNEQTIDPDEGVLRKRKLINPKYFNNYVSWYPIGDELIFSAEKGLGLLK